MTDSTCVLQGYEAILVGLGIMDSSLNREVIGKIVCNGSGR